MSGQHKNFGHVRRQTSSMLCCRSSHPACSSVFQFPARVPSQHGRILPSYSTSCPAVKPVFFRAPNLFLPFNLSTTSSRLLTRPFWSTAYITSQYICYIYVCLIYLYLYVLLSSTHQSFLTSSTPMAFQLSREEVIQINNEGELAQHRYILSSLDPSTYIGSLVASKGTSSTACSCFSSTHFTY